ncbi:hypothetical protein BH11PSE2_BH11PSE2_09490 [soil metagenome]
MDQDLSVYSFRPSRGFQTLALTVMAVLALFGLARGFLDQADFSLTPTVTAETRPDDGRQYAALPTQARATITPAAPAAPKPAQITAPTTGSDQAAPKPLVAPPPANAAPVAPKVIAETAPITRVDAPPAPLAPPPEPRPAPPTETAASIPF